MAQRDPFRANGGIGQDGMRHKRAGYPGFVPAIQPGSARYPAVAPDEDKTDARDVLVPPNVPFNPLDWNHQSIVAALGMQAAFSAPRVRFLVQDMIDSMLRRTWKPTTSPPWIEKPYRAKDFGGFASMTALASPVDWTTLADANTTLSFLMPTGYFGVLREFAQGANSATDWDSICWRVTLDGIPQFPWNNVCCEVGTFPHPRKVQIIIPPGSTIALQVKNSSLANIDNIAGMLYGWMWPSAGAGGDGEGPHSQASVA